MLALLLASDTGCVVRTAYDVHRGVNSVGRNRATRLGASTHPSALSSMVALQAQCSERTRQSRQNLARLDHVRAVLAPECTFRESSADGLKMRLSCRSRMLFDAGNDRLKPEFEAQLPSTSQCRLTLETAGVLSRMGCVGEILASAADFAEIRVGVVATVDRLPLLDQQQGCMDVGGVFNTPAAQSTWHHGEAGMWAANDRLAYCRAARVASAIYHGINEVFRSYRYMGPEVDPPLIPVVTVAALGASDAYYDLLHCPSSGTGECSEARRVEVLLEIVPRRDSQQWVCPHHASDARTALYCLQSCEQLANARISAMNTDGNATTRDNPDELSPPAENDCWHFVSTNPRQTRFSAALLAQSLGLNSSAPSNNVAPQCGAAAAFHRRQHHTSFQ